MNIANRWVFIAGLTANLLLVLWTLVAFDQDWSGAFWPLFSVWTAVIVLFVLLAFVARATPRSTSSSSRTGGQSHE